MNNISQITSNICYPSIIYIISGLLMIFFYLLYELYKGILNKNIKDSFTPENVYWLIVTISSTIAIFLLIIGLCNFSQAIAWVLVAILIISYIVTIFSKLLEKDDK